MDETGKECETDDQNSDKPDLAGMCTGEIYCQGPGNGEYDKEHQNIYLDCGSVTATDISGEMGLMSPDWKDGCKTELTVTRNEIEICMSSIESGIRFPRGYYRFFIGDTQKLSSMYFNEKESG